MFYNEYFELRPDFAPCMSLDAINVRPDAWLDFYPHESFVGILRTLLGNLEGGGKSLWITGAYGTGKSHASLVLQKLFMDDETRVRQWMKDHEERIPAPVRDGLMSWRARSVLVAYDVNSDGVDPKRQFLIRMQRGISRALRGARPGAILPQRGSLEEIVERIRQDGRFFFEQRDRMQAELPALHSGIASADDLEKALGASADSALISDVMRVLEARSIYLEISAESFLEWLRETLERNGCSKLVYIWDEFSSFMERNRNELKTMEQLAEAVTGGRFHFVPVTHTEISSYMAEGSESAKKANGRFEFRRLEMPNNTALKLAAHALRARDGREREWEQERDFLWQAVRGMVEKYMAPGGADIEAEDFRNVLPLHPMAAFLLKHLSTVVGSNQRSMFEFLNGADFRSFIETGGPDVAHRQLLTADHLWPYFLERDDLGVDARVREVRAGYERRKRDLGEDGRRVLKAVLLFMLLEHIQDAGSPLLRATVENVARAFEGDGALTNVEEIIKDLEGKHCFAVVNGRCVPFRDRGDDKDVRDKVEALRGRFDKLVLEDTAKSLGEQLKRVNPGRRFEVRVVGVGAGPNVPNREEFSDEGNRILIQFILARDGQDQLKAHAAALDLAKHFRDHRMIFVTAPDVTFCRDDADAWEKFVKNEARRALAPDAGTRRPFEEENEAAKKAWLARLTQRNPKLVVCRPNPGGRPFVEEITWEHLLKTGWLADCARQSFELYTDDLCDFNVSAFGAATGLKNWAKAGMSLATTGAGKTVADAWRKRGISADDSWFASHPDHPLTRLRDRCKAYLDNTVGRGDTCSLRRLYIELRRPPYALLPVPHSAFVLGFVLRGWPQDRRGLQWTDGVRTQPLDEDTLAEIIEAAVKNDGGEKISNEKRICRLSREDKALIEAVPAIFGGDPIAEGTVEEALRTAFDRLERISPRVPLWVLPDWIRSSGNPGAGAMCAFIDGLCAVAGISSKGQVSVRAEKAREIGGILLENDGLAAEMHDIMTPQHLEDAFRRWVDGRRPELREAAERTGDTAGRHYKDIKNRFASAAGWLWKMGDVDAVLDECLARMRFAERAGILAGTAEPMGFDDALAHMRGAVWNRNRVPTGWWAEKHPVLRRLFEALDSPAPSAADVMEIVGIMEQHGDVLRVLFFHPAHPQQLTALGEMFGAEWPSSPADADAVYGRLPEGAARMGLDTFREQGLAVIEAWRRGSLAQRVAALWKERTGTDSPRSWSGEHALPARCLLDIPDAADVVRIVARPGEASPERLDQVCGTLEQPDVLRDIRAAGEAFLKRAVPAHLRAVSLDAGDLGAWLRDHLDADPESWPEHPGLADAVERFVRDRYDAHLLPQARSRAAALSEAKAKDVLLHLVNRFPDVGLFLLGGDA